MPTPNWSEIKTRAIAFANEWQGEASERAEAQSFWNDFFKIFDVPRRRVATFEASVKKLNRNKGRIDCFWPATLLIEHKSAGENLDAAYIQATDYFYGLNDDELPGHILVSDFANFRLYNLDDNTHTQFKLNELHKNIERFSFILGYKKQKIREQDPVNLKAVEKMGKLHDALKQDGYAGHQLELLLVRLLFCLFADDTGIFSPRDMMLDHLSSDTKEDGSDLGLVLGKIFETLNKNYPLRQKSLPAGYAAYPYVNGKLFEEHFALPSFTKQMRDLLIDCCTLDWSKISPAIFGAMFQKIIELDEKDCRRQMGAHYTSEENILKLIGPLFLDELKAEFEQGKHHKNQLFEFHKKLTHLRFLDPACGCGNFLVITYRELRMLELEVLKAAEAFGERTGSVFKAISVDVDQFSGIELEEFPAQIAQVAMWLIDHQMNIATGELFGEWFARIPLTKSANIRIGNALRLDWEAFCPPNQLEFILDNPPFIGKQNQDASQKEDMEFVTKGIKSAGVLDYVAGWYIKAAQYLSGSKIGSISRDKHHFLDAEFSGFGAKSGVEDIFVSAEKADNAARSKVKVGFVSTNSITQGEQVGVLWSMLLAQGMQIQFAHRTFQWSNEAPGKAAVHCVIIGFGREAVKKKHLFEYADIKGLPHKIAAGNINPYLVDAPDVVLPARRNPLCNVPEPSYGSFALDDGNLTISQLDYDDILVENPQALKFLKPFIGGQELLHSEKRWCLWLEHIQPNELKSLNSIYRRVEAVREWRNKSDRKTTKKLALSPTMFAEIRQPKTSYLALPTTSSENRRFLPIAFLQADVIASNQIYIVPNASLYHFGILTSTMHNAWVRQVCGRLKSDFRYSNTIVYNNFPSPNVSVIAGSTRKLGSQAEMPSQVQHDSAKFEVPNQVPHNKLVDSIETAAQAVLDARALFPNESLANLYSPETMPPSLVKAHAALDKAVDAAYAPDGGTKSYASDAERVAFLFKRYQQLTSLI